MVSNKIDLNKLKLVKSIGQGYFCDVAKYIDQETQTEYALKKLKKEHKENGEFIYRFRREIKILKELQDCTNIIDLINYQDDEERDELWYLMYCGQSNLHHYIKMNNTKLTVQNRYEIAEQIIEAVRFAHAKDLLHRDLNPNNVIIFETIDKSISCKVSDFGLGKDIQSLSFYTQSNTSSCGQAYYVAPEQYESLKKATKKSDLFSLGKLIYFIFTGKEPSILQSFNLSSLVGKATEHNPEDRHEQIGEFIEHFQTLKDLELNLNVSATDIALTDYLLDIKQIDWIRLHNLLLVRKYNPDVYQEYIKPINDFFRTRNNFTMYYSKLGKTCRDFVIAYTDYLEYFFENTRFEFNHLDPIVQMLSTIIRNIDDDTARLNCHKRLWYIAIYYNRFTAQSAIRELLSSAYLPITIQTELAEIIKYLGCNIDKEIFGTVRVPPIILSAINNSNISNGLNF